MILTGVAVRNKESTSPRQMPEVIDSSFVNHPPAVEISFKSYFFCETELLKNVLSLTLAVNLLDEAPNNEKVSTIGRRLNWGVTQQPKLNHQKLTQTWKTRTIE